MAFIHKIDADPEFAPWRRVFRILGVGIAMGAVLFIFHNSRLMENILYDTATLQHGLQGIAVFTGVAILFCTVGFPRQIVCFAAGVSFGVGYGILYALSVTVFGAYLAFIWARWGGRNWVHRWLSGQGKQAKKAARVQAFFSSKPFWSILTLRLLPVGSAVIVNLLSGVMEIKILPFIMATALGSLPQTIVFVLLGSGMAIGHTVQLVGGVLLFVVSSLLGVWLLVQRRSI